MLLTLGLGVVLAIGLLSSGPLLVNTVMDFALPYKLRGASPLDGNIRLTTYVSLDLEGYMELDAHMRSLVELQVGKNIDEIFSSAGSGWAYPWIEGYVVRNQRVNLRFYEGIKDRIEFIEGGWPDGSIMQGEEVSVIIGETFAEAYNLEVGDRLPLSRRENEPRPSFWLRVTGIARPTNARDSYWFGALSPLRVQSDTRWTAQYSAIIPREEFFSIQGTWFQAARPELNWNIFIDPATIRAKDVPVLRMQLGFLRGDIAELEHSVSVETKLDTVLRDFLLQSRVVQITLYVLIIEVLFLALYYIAMVATLSSQQVEGEFTSLSSRGASYVQIFRIQASEAILIGLVAFLVGPGLAWVIVWALSKVGPMADVSQVDWILRLPSLSWVAAGVGALACVLGEILPVGPTMKRSVVVHARAVSRSERVPWWQRLYLDVLGLLLALVLLWRFYYSGNAAFGNSYGQVDWLLLLSPLTLLLGSATILLRIFPQLFRGLAWLAARGRGLSTALAMWQISRNPTHVARLVLLLTLTMALGVLSSGLTATMDISEFERALYSAGSDVRLIFDRYQPLSEFSAFPGVEAVSSTWRGSGSVDVRSDRTFPVFDILAIEPYSFVEVTRYRHDYADEPMGRLVSFLVADLSQIPDTTIPLPGQPSRLGVWILDNTWRSGEEKPIEHLTFRAKLRTAQGEMLLVDLGLTPLLTELDNLSTDAESELEQVWRYFEASVPPFPAESYPLSIHSFWFGVRPMERNFWRLSFILDDFVVIDRQNGETSIFEDFETPQRIWMVNDPLARVSFTRQVPAHSGRGTINLEIPGAPNPFGLALTRAGNLSYDAIPVLASEEFMLMTKLEVWESFTGSINGRRVLMRILGVVRYFPTLYDKPSRGFLVTSRDLLLAQLNQEVRNPINPDEVWIEFGSQKLAGSLIESYPDAIQVVEFEQERRAIKADPLSLGLRSVTFLGYVITAVLSLTGFATHFYMSARKREMMYGILRSLGLSPGQLYGSLFFEQMLLIFLGISLGSILGILLNKVILPGLPISFGDRPPIPPFIPFDDWQAIGKLYIILTGAFILSMGVAVYLLWRARIHRVMRIGQE